ncbi:MAG: methionyl-tRNA formyltransferase, partial [Clostridia bacterium]|nr:methionyl-tRNA formyltransferase [Clostridia bacterium]
TKVKQDEKLAVHVKMIKKEDGIIDFSKSAEQIVNLIKGLYVWPVAYTFYEGKMLKIYKASAVEGDKPCGEVVESDAKKGLYIGTGKGLLKVEEVQLEGSKRMPIKDFLLGKKIGVGYRF